jgi:hypothetical protein
MKKWIPLWHKVSYYVRKSGEFHQKNSKSFGLNSPLNFKRHMFRSRAICSCGFWIFPCVLIEIRFEFRTISGRTFEMPLSLTDMLSKVFRLPVRSCRYQSSMCLIPISASKPMICLANCQTRSSDFQKYSVCRMMRPASIIGDNLSLILETTELKPM